MAVFLKARPAFDPELLRSVEARTDGIAETGALDPANFDYDLREDQLYAMEREIEDLLETARIELEVATHSFLELQRFLHFTEDDLIGRWFHGWSVQEPIHGVIQTNFVRAFNNAVPADRRVAIPAPNSKPNASTKQKAAQLVTGFESFLLPAQVTAFRIGHAHEALTFDAYRRQNARRRQAGLRNPAVAGGHIAAQEVPHRDGYEELDQLFTPRLRTQEAKVAEWMVVNGFSPLGVNNPGQAEQLSRMASGLNIDTDSVMSTLRNQNVFRYFGARAINAVEDAYREVLEA